MNYNLKTAKIFTWNGRAITLEELHRIKDFYLMGADERRFLTEIIAKFDMISGDIEISKVKKAMNDALDKATCIDKEATITTGNTINFRDWIMGKANPIGKSVVINEADFDLLAKHYKNFILVEPEIAFRIKRDKKVIDVQQEKIEEDIRHIQANCNDKEAYGAINLSYLQWKRVGRFVKQGEKSTFYTLDAAGVKYALFSFNQTDVAEERYKSKSEQTKMCACGAQECFGCRLGPNS